MADRLMSARIEEAMRREVVTIDPQDTLLTAARTMLDLGVRHLPVVNDAGDLVGIVSERDLRARIGASLGEWPKAESQLQDVVANLMTPDPLVLRASHPVQKAMEVFEDERIGALPIVDDNDRLVGMLSYIDLLDWVQRTLTKHPTTGEHPPPAVPPDEAKEHTRELTGYDASTAQATLGSAEPPPEQAEDLVGGVEDIEEKPDARDLEPDHIEALEPSEDEDVEVIQQGEDTRGP